VLGILFSGRFLITYATAFLSREYLVAAIDELKPKEQAGS